MRLAEHPLTRAGLPVLVAAAAVRDANTLARPSRPSRTMRSAGPAGRPGLSPRGRAGAEEVWDAAR
ncbi:hypothetical protein [Amycolatopsis sp. NPDC051102]|uniref:hypothetical protein n=1 Tax=Amycolatopsis sp. NPDC051102 TaxID=3155163 RepID=UPI0034387EDA